jgi:guanidinobutyrase
MVAIARRRNPRLRFEFASRLDLPYADGVWTGVVAIYSIIHLDDAQRSQAFSEFSRTLKPGGRLLVSFHVDGPGFAQGEIFVIGHPARLQVLNGAGRYCHRMGEEHDHQPQRDIPPGMAEQLDLAHSGMVSFGHRPFLTEVEQLDSWRPDVAIVGAPFDIATTNRPGARFGPRAIRATAYEPGSYHLDFGLEIFDWLEVVDFGDAYCPHGQTEVSHANIRERVHAIASRGIVPVILGGDHSITWPTATAVAVVHGYGNVGIVHFDAHADTADEIEGNLASHGTPMRRLIESGAVPGTHFVQVGLRGYWPPQDVFEWMLEQGMTWHTMQEIWDRGFKEVMRQAVGEALAKAEKLYVSVDIDVLDPSHAPGTGTPEPGGITSADLLRMVRQLCYEHDVAGVDVVEVAPVYDHAELTVNAAHRVVLEALAGMAARRRDATDAQPGPPALRRDAADAKRGAPER